MNQTTSPPSYFRTVSQQLFTELIELLCQGRHVALLAPRQSGKALVLFELRARSRSLSIADRPEVIILRSLDIRGDSRTGYVKQLARHLNVSEPNDVDYCRGSLAAEVLEVLRYAVENRRTPLWLFVQNITELPQPLTKALLSALGSASEDFFFRGRFAAVVTGGEDFVPLTYDANSPYRHAEKYFLQRFDRELTARFFRARIAGVSLHEGFAEVPDDATPPIDSNTLDYVFEQTGGYSRFIEEIVLTRSRVAPYVEFNHSGNWTRECVAELIKRFLTEHMHFDQFCRLSMRDIERNSDAWSKLQQLVNDSEGRVRIPDGRPHILETSGIARRINSSTAIFASPMWTTFLKARINPQYGADVYARLGEWDLAWSQYTGLNAADCDRPLDGDERYRLESVIDDWEDYLVEVTTHGAIYVANTFLAGARHLYGCDTGVLFDQASRRLINYFPPDLTATSEEFTGDCSICIPDGMIEIQIAPSRDTIESSPKRNLPAEPSVLEHPEFDLVLRLRRNTEVGFDAAALKSLRRSLRRFWLAYMTAVRMEYASLREKHLKVVARVNELLSHFPGDMGRVVEGTVDSLIDVAGYYRIQICLISPKGDRIQGVAGRCSDPSFRFADRTDFPLDRESPECDWDVQKWVAIKGVTVAIDDASDEKQKYPKTNIAQALEIGMKGIAVVPMKVARADAKTEEILGTIHFERKDKGRPSEVELRSFEVLASQIAVAFDHARQQTMLEKALSALKSEFRIVSPDRRIVVHNHPAKKADGADGELWLYPISTQSAQSTDERFNRGVIDEAETENKGVHHYVKNGDQAFDDFAAPINDWRSKLEGTFKSDGMLGFVYQSIELSDLVRIHEASQQWLSLDSSRETAHRILDYFQTQKFDWCRIYLFKNRDRLESFEEFGIPDPTRRQKFRDGGFFVDRSDVGQQAFFLTDDFSDLAVLSYDSAITGPPVPDAEPRQGIPTFRTRDNWREEFNKEDIKWLEAPLIVGDELVGLIALSKPSSFSPKSYQVLRWTVLSVAVALHNALDAERRRSLELAGAKEEAWKSASQLAIHQLANKLAPAESDCRFVQKWLRLHVPSVITTHHEVDAALTNSQNSIEFARQILMDFRRYASDEPFKDIQAYRVDELLKDVQEHLISVCQGLNLTAESTATKKQVRCSRSAMLEVFEILALNSLAHSGKSAAELQVTIAIENEVTPGSLVVVPGNTVCIVYSDNGNGISELDRSRIFDAFFTTDQKGNGLGLAIAKRFMHRQSGRITEEGAGKSGARFCVYLPIVDEEFQEMRYEESHEETANR